MLGCMVLFFFFKQKTEYEMRISDWSSDVCSSDLQPWDVRPSRAEVEPTLREQAVSAKAERFARVADHPVVARVLELFPGARIEEVTAPPPETAVAPDDDDDGGDPDTVAPEDHAPEASTRSKANQA